MNKTTLLNLLIITLLSTPAYAQNRSPAHFFGAPIQANAVVTKSNVMGYGLQSNLPMQPQYRTVFLMNIPLTREQKNTLQTFTEDNTSYSSPTQKSSLPSHVELGMNEVPVLDQGQHGACVTFANTGALDALIAKGDYISQLCSLELGDYLEKLSYLPSGWDGTFGPESLGRLMEFGVVSMTNQTKQSCAGVTAYPGGDMANLGKPMSLDENAKISEGINYDYYWYPLISSTERFAWSSKNTEAPNNLLLNVKQVLASPNAKQTLRLTFGALLPVEYCSAGACAKYHKPDDTWAITKAIKNAKDPEFGGHEMIITGYNDNATAIDNEGTKHTGLLILRNSWSDKHGDNGDFYMTYDFFKQYVMEVQVVGKYE